MVSEWRLGLRVGVCLGLQGVSVYVLVVSRSLSRWCLGCVLVSRSRRCLDLCLGGFSVWVLLVSRFMSRSCVFVVFRWRLGL